jgi:hypothetical protein
MEIQGLILIFFWTILWIMGGLLIIANLFVTTENETFFLGAATGLVLENWLANLLSQIINPLIGFWLAPGLVQEYIYYNINFLVHSCPGIIFFDWSWITYF